MEGYEKNDGMEMNDRDEIYSKPVRAGKRTYFFDVKATRNNDYYLTITESKKKLEKDGSQNYEKHKIFLYKEDFDKFAEGLDNAVAYIKAALNGETMAVHEEIETNKFGENSLWIYIITKKLFIVKSFFVIIYIHKEFSPNLLPFD